MTNTKKNVATESEVVCKHKPGDVWEKGCCTSKANDGTGASAKVSADTHEGSQAVSSTKDQQDV